MNDYIIPAPLCGSNRIYVRRQAEAATAVITVIYTANPLTLF